MAEGRFRLAHFTDAHLPTHGRFRARELAGKRGLGALNWARSRRHLHRMSVADALAADLIAHRPDHIAMTGDAVNFGLPREYAAAANWLSRLAEGQDLSFVPGNHEALTGAHAGAQHAAYAPFMTDDAGRAGFPYLRRRGPAVLIGLSSAIPSPVFQAYGRLGAAQRARLADRLRAARGHFRVVLIHHPPVPTTPGRRALKDRRDFAEVIAAEGAELILYGHNHRAELGAVAGLDHPVPALGAPSASIPFGGHGAAAEWRLIEIGVENGEWAVHITRRALARSGAFETVGQFRLTAPRPHV